MRGLDPAVDALAEVELELALDVQSSLTLPSVSVAVHVAEVASPCRRCAGERKRSQSVMRAGDRAFEDLRVVVARRGAHLALNVSVGRLEMMLIAPPIELRPYSVPCGPRSTSMRSMKIGRLAGFDVARGVEAVGVGRDAGIGAVVVGQAADAAQAHAVQRGRIGQARREIRQLLDRW